MARSNQQHARGKNPTQVNQPQVFRQGKVRVIVIAHLHPYHVKPWTNWTYTITGVADVASTVRHEGVDFNRMRRTILKLAGIDIEPSLGETTPSPIDPE